MSVFLDAQGRVYHNGQVIKGLPLIREYKSGSFRSSFIDYEGQAWLMDRIPGTGDYPQPTLIEGLPHDIRSIRHYYTTRMIILTQDGSVWTCDILTSGRVTNLKRLELAFGHAAVSIGGSRYNKSIVLDDQHQLHYFKSLELRRKLPGIAAFEIDSSYIIMLHVDGHVSTSCDNFKTVQPVEGLEDIQAISCSNSSFLALTSNGRVYRWGNSNYLRQLGRSSILRKDYDPQVIPGLPPVRDILAVSIC